MSWHFDIRQVKFEFSLEQAGDFNFTIRPAGYWILRDGYFDDNGIWIDSEIWRDS